MDSTDSKKQEFKELADKAWEQLRSWCYEDESWKASFTKEGVDVSKLDLKETDWHGKGKLYKAVGVVQNCSVEDMARLVSNVDTRPLWDAQNDMYTVMEVINEEIDLVHTGVKGVVAVSPRDFTSVRKTVFDKEKGLWISAQVSCEFDTPEHFKKRYVRGLVLPSGWCVERIDDTSCKVFYVAGVYLAGWLPTSLVQSAIEQNTYKFFPMVRDVFANRDKYPVLNKKD